MTHRRLLATCTLTLVGVVLAACSSSKSSDKTTSPTTSAGSSSASAPASSTAASASGTTSGAALSGTYNVLAVVASSGPLAAVTAAEMDGMKAAVTYVNANGGIDGKKVKLTIKNDNADPATAANVLQQALSANTPDLVYPGTTSTETAAMVPILNQKKILSIQTAVSDETVNPAKYPYEFSLASSAADFAQELASGIKAKYPTAKKIGIIIGNDVTGSSNMKNELSALHAAGFTTTVETYNPASTVDMTPQMEALKAQNPDLVVAGGFGAVAGYILKARTKIGWTTPLIGDASFSSNSLPSLTTAAGLKGVSITSTSALVYQALSSRGKAFQTLFNEVKPASGTFTAPFLLYGFGWDDIILARDAAAQAKAVDTVAMTKALENLTNSNDPDFVNSGYKYSSTVHSSIADLSKATLASPYDKDGQPLPFGQTG